LIEPFGEAQSIVTLAFPGFLLAWWLAVLFLARCPMIQASVASFMEPESASVPCSPLECSGGSRCSGVSLQRNIRSPI